MPDRNDKFQLGGHGKIYAATRGEEDTDNGGKKNRVALANHHSLRTPRPGF